MELRPGILRRAAQLRAVGELRAPVRPGTQIWLGRLASDGCHFRRMDAERHLPGAQRLPDHGHRRRESIAAGRARQRAAQLRRQPGTVRSVNQPLAGHRRVRARAARHVGQLRHRRRPRAVVSEHRRGHREALQRRRRAPLRVPCRGVQPVQHAQLRPAGAGHQRAEHVRTDHEHGQYRTDGGAGAEVLFLARLRLRPLEAPPR